MTPRLSICRSMSNKKKNVDRISLLPDSLLHEILSFLNTKQVVQTCVLSKRWKTVWTCIPALNFDTKSYPFGSFSHFILRFLSKRCGSHIKKLSYSAVNRHPGDEKHLVEFLLCYAACHTVQELFIKTDHNSRLDWIDCLSEHQSLNVLKISCRFHEEWGVLMLPSLRILEIESIDLGILVIKENIFSGCPNLETLVLIGVGWEGCARICAPKLQNFELRCCPPEWDLTCEEIELCTPNLRCVKIGQSIPIVKSAFDFPCLDRVYVAGDVYDYSVTKPFQNIVEFFRLFQNVRSITMPLIAMQALLSVPIANLMFHNLKHLKLEASKTSKKIDLPMNQLQYLLKCRSLETMVIDLI